MPKYDFKCDTCEGSLVEMHLTFDSTERPNCDRCGNAMSKVFTCKVVGEESRGGLCHVHDPNGKYQVQHPKFAEAVKRIQEKELT